MQQQTHNFEYQMFIEMSRDIQFVVQEVENNDGVLTEELEIFFKELGMELDENLFRIRNIVEELEGMIESRKKEIKRLESKNKSTITSIDSWKKLLIALTKEGGKLNGSNNPTRNAGGVSFTVTKSKSVVVEDDFKDPRYTKWKIGEAVPEEHRDKIINYIKYHLKASDVKVDKVVDKMALKKDIEALPEGVEIKGAHIAEKENITMR